MTREETVRRTDADTPPARRRYLLRTVYSATAARKEKKSGGDTLRNAFRGLLTRLRRPDTGDRAAGKEKSLPRKRKRRHAGKRRRGTVSRRMPRT